MDTTSGTPTSEKCPPSMLLCRSSRTKIRTAPGTLVGDYKCLNMNDTLVRPSLRTNLVKCQSLENIEQSTTDSPSSENLTTHEKTLTIPSMQVASSKGEEVPGGGTLLRSSDYLC